MYALQMTMAVLLAYTASAERIIGDAGNGETFPIDISVNGHVVTVVSGQPDPPQSFFTPTINMYDFDAKREARKVVAVNRKAVCYIKVLDVEFDQVEKFFSDFKSNDNHVTTHVLEEWNVRGAKIAPEDLEQTVGAEIAKFCSGYQVFWMKSGRKVMRKVGHRVKRQRQRWTANLKFSFNDKGFSASVGVTFKF